MAGSRETLQNGEKTKAKINPQQGSGIRCPACGGPTKVIRTDPKPELSIHGRYRKCDICNRRIYTEETVTNTHVEIQRHHKKKED